MNQKLTRETCTPDQLACWEVLSTVFGGDHHLGPISDFGDGINGSKHPWESDPYVWVVEFKRIDP